MKNVLQGAQSSMTQVMQDGRSTDQEIVFSLFSPSLFPGNAYNEILASSSAYRSHWDPIITAFNHIGKTKLMQLHERATHKRHEDGATINPFDDLTQQTTSWALDVVPFLLTPDEWRTIEAGVRQRAMLLEQVLADVYGPQNLLNSGAIPPELVFANPSFMHACHGIMPSGNRYLSFYAVDLYRDKDGNFTVARDYGNNPAGLGYALENRVVMSRIFSNLYHKSQIKRLAPFFQQFHRALTSRASIRHKDPGIVLFSPGPDSPIYFEHAFLSRYLGYPLVEGQDLTVRDGQVFLKKLAGLEPVEAIFRHIDDQNSDPFALRRGTADGVAGLIQVCREQNIDVVNPVGSGFIDTPLLQTYLPALSREMTGGELQLPSRQSWWCGTAEGLAYTVANINSLEIGPAMDCNQQMDQTVELLARVQADPTSFIASAALQPSSSACWSETGFTSRPTLLRIFACATEEGFAVMPGGLAITGDSTANLVNGNPDRQQSKDIWVLSDHPVEPFSLMADFHTVAEFKRSSDLPSRVADNLLWLGRYLERAEGQIRLLRAVYKSVSGEERPEEVPELRFLLTLLENEQILPKIEVGGEASGFSLKLLSQLYEALYDKNNQGSVCSILRMVQRTARNVRDRLSLDSSRVINQLEHFTKDLTADPLEQLENTLFTLSAFSGLAMESMTRGLGWRFMDMGRRLERAMSRTRLVRIGLPMVCGDAHNTLRALLEISDSNMTYRARYRSAFQVPPVLDLLLSDESNPKSLAFQFVMLAEHVEQLPQQFERPFSTDEERIMLKLLTEVRLLDFSGTECNASPEKHPELMNFLVQTEAQLKAFAQHLTGHYLSRVPATPHYAMVHNTPSV